MILTILGLLVLTALVCSAMVLTAGGHRARGRELPPPPAPALLVVAEPDAGLSVLDQAPATGDVYAEDLPGGPAGALAADPVDMAISDAVQLLHRQRRCPCPWCWADDRQIAEQAASIWGGLHTPPVIPGREDQL